MISIGNVNSEKLSSYYIKDDYYFKQEDKNSIQVYGTGSFERDLVNNKTMDKKLVFESLTLDRAIKAKDITFSTVKSLSIMFAVGTTEQRDFVISVHRNAIDKTMKYIERQLFNVRKKENGIVKTVPAGGMVALGIEHSVSRKAKIELYQHLDPQIHTHVLIANTGYIKGEKKNRSVNYQSIYQNQKKLDRIYKTYMRKELDKFGYKTRTRESGFELTDITDKQIRYFSARSTQVENNLAAMGLTRKKANAFQRQQAALKGRQSKKEEISSEDMVIAWKTDAEKLGIKLTFNSQAVPLQERDESAIRKVIKKGCQDYISRTSLTTKHQAVEEILKFAELGNAADENIPLITLDDIEEHLPAIMKNERMVRLPGQKEKAGSIKEQFVSVNHLVADQENMQYLEQGRDFFEVPEVIEEQIDNVAREIFSFKFEGEQRRAAIGVLKSKDFVTGIQGDPGTGKTTLLQAVARIQGEKNILVLSKAGSAAKKLGQEIGVKARTIEKLLNDWKVRKELLGKEGLISKEQRRLKTTGYVENLTRDPEKPAIIIVDEASMLGDLDFNRLAKIAEETRSKIVLAGDIYQLPGITVGETFKKFQDAGMQTFNLKQIHRQSDERELAAVQAITLKHDAEEAVRILKGIPDIIKEKKTLSSRIEHMKNDYIATVKTGGLNPLLITGTNAEKDALNREIRSKLKELGILENEGEVHPAFNSRRMKVKLEVCPRDRIVFLQNDNDLVVKASSGQQILNGDQAIVRTISNGQINAVLMDNEGRPTDTDIVFQLDEYNRIDHSYALRTYKSQGQSVERNVMYHAPSTSPFLSKNDFLVEISRNKERLNIYTDDVRKMTEKASAWVNKDDSMKAYRLGYSISFGKSEYVSMCVAAAKKKQIRDSEILERRQDLLRRYEKFSNAPRSKRDTINVALNDSRSIFYYELVYAQKFVPAEQQRDAMEAVLYADYVKWEKLRKKAEKDFRNDKARNRHVTYYRALHRNDNKFCDVALKYQNSQVDYELASIYKQVNSELGKIFNTELFVPFSPAVDRIQFEFSDSDSYIMTEEQELQLQLFEIEEELVQLEMTDDELSGLIFHTADEKLKNKYFELQKRADSLRRQYSKNDLILNKLRNKIEHHELNGAGRIRKAFSPRKNKELILLVKDFETISQQNRDINKEIDSIELKNKPFEDELSKKAAFLKNENAELRESRLAEKTEIMEKLKDFKDVDSDLDSTPIAIPDAQDEIEQDEIEQEPQNWEVDEDDDFDYGPRM